MRKLTISVTDAARNFANCINRVRYQNVIFVLIKNGSPVARLVPDSEKVCTGRDLAGVLVEIGLPPGEAAASYHDLRTARKTLKSPADKWLL